MPTLFPVTAGEIDWKSFVHKKLDGRSPGRQKPRTAEGLSRDLLASEDLGLVS